jgi:magnesium transporter
MIELVYSKEPKAADEYGRCVIAVAPDAGEQRELAEKYGVDPVLIAHCLDENERARIRRSGNSALTILRVPYRLGASAEIPFATTPLGLIACDHTLAVVTARDNVVVEGLVEHIKAEVTVLKKHQVLLKALELTAEVFLDDLDRINDAADRVEDRLRESLANSEVMLLLRYQKALVYFTAALGAIDHLVDHLRELPAFRESESESARFDDAAAEIKQALEVATVSRDILSEMMDAFASIISNNLNIVMKFLAAFTIILTVPMTVASFYGMNVGLPGGKDPYAFWILIGVSLALGGGVFAAFRYKKWL